MQRLAQGHVRSRKQHARTGGHLLRSISGERLRLPWLPRLIHGAMTEAGVSSATPARSSVHLSYPAQSGVSLTRSSSNSNVPSGRMVARAVALTRA